MSALKQTPCQGMHLTCASTETLCESKYGMPQTSLVEYYDDKILIYRIAPEQFLVMSKS